MTARPRLVGALAGLLATAWFFLLALARFNQGKATSYDLTIFSQAAAAWSRGELPRSFVRGPDTLLADHFSPATAVFAPVWAVWPDPRALLLTQAVCLGLAVGIVVTTAYVRLGPAAAGWVLLTALLGRMLVAGDIFDVHEVALAVPLMAVLGWALLEQRLAAAVLASLGLVLVKEDLGLTVVAAGAVWWWLRGRGRRALAEGASLVAIGVAGLALAVVVIAHFNGGGSSYLDYFTGGSGGALADHSARPTPGLHLGQRVLPVLLLTATAFVVGWRSPLILLALPTLAWRLLSSNASYWSVSFHYDLVLWPVAVLAAVDAVRRHRLAERAWLRPVAALSGLAVMASGLTLLVDKGIDPRAAFSRSAELADLDRLMVGVPAGATVAAQNHLGPYLTPRFEVTMLGTGRPERVRYVVLAADQRPEFQAPPCARDQLLRELRGQPGVVIRRVGDLVLADLGTARPAGLRACPGG